MKGEVEGDAPTCKAKPGLPECTVGENPCDTFELVDGKCMKDGEEGDAPTCKERELPECNDG